MTEQQKKVKEYISDIFDEDNANARIVNLGFDYKEVRDSTIVEIIKLKSDKGYRKIVIYNELGKLLGFDPKYIQKIYLKNTNDV